jgi:formylglycine-generating enzyme required for sulfatase activity
LGSSSPNPSPPTTTTKAPPSDTDLELSTIAWGEDNRALFDIMREKGAVYAQYRQEQGTAALTLIDGCNRAVTYEATPFREVKPYSVVLHNRDEAVARFPLGVTNYIKHFDGQRVMRADVVIAGVATIARQEPASQTASINAECAKATHWVSRIYLGVFAFAVGGEAELSGQTGQLFRNQPPAQVHVFDRAGSIEDTHSLTIQSLWKLHPVLLRLSPMASTGMSKRVPIAYAGEKVTIPASQFSPGDDELKDAQPRYADGKPVSHRIAAFQIDRTEVTVAHYNACVGAGFCSPAVSKYHNNCNASFIGRDDYPVNCVSFEQAKTFCESLGERLPTELEWELAARGTDGRRYPWGNDEPLNQLCWKRVIANRSLETSSCPVGSHPSGASPFGVEDMAGSVFEWTDTPWCDSYQSNRHCSSTSRVIRGGSVRDEDLTYFRCANREESSEDAVNTFIGFRCVRAERAATTAK